MRSALLLLSLQTSVALKIGLAFFSNRLLRKLGRGSGSPKTHGEKQESGRRKVKDFMVRSVKESHFHGKRENGEGKKSRKGP